MKIGQRVVNYIILFITYWLSTSLLISLDTLLKTNNVFITLYIGFIIIDIVVAFLILKLRPLLNILAGIILACLSLFLALRFGDLGLFEHYDPYSILTSILSNAVFSIIFWEILYQIKRNQQKKNHE